MTNNNEKRSETRLTEQTTIFLETYDGNADTRQVVICSSLDISANGIQFQIDEAIEVGSILRLCTEFHLQQKTLYLVGEIKWARPEDDHYNIGFEIYDAEQTDVIEWKKFIAERLHVDHSS